MVQSLASADVLIIHHNTCACVTKYSSYQIQIIIFVIAVTATGFAAATCRNTRHPLTNAI